MKKNLKKGFTLVEMLVVVAIIGVLSTVLYTSYNRYIGYTKSTVAKSEIIAIVQSYEAAMISNSVNRQEGAAVNPENFTSYDELFELDLVEVYNYINKTTLSTSISLEVKDGDKIMYTNTAEGVEIVYNPSTREFISVIIF